MKQKIVTGITATGKLTLGNYIGAIKNLINLQDQYDLFIFVADLHALTTYIDPEQLRKNKKDIFALYLACGLDPEKVTLFFQSDISAHSELNWIITSITNMGELSRMTQFKDKTQNILKQENGTETIPVGLFVYPSLMSADIILYNPTYVSVGIDQKQHLELCQKLVKRLNKKYNLNFNEPKPLISKIGSKIKSLQDPFLKMSKSDKNENSSIYLLDDPEKAYKKIQKAVTDGENKIYISEDKPGILNLLTIFASLKDITLEEAEQHFKNKNYKDLKEEVGILVKNFLESIQKKYKKTLEQIETISKIGKERASKIANENLLNIKKAFGLK